MGLKPYQLNDSITAEWSKLVATTWLGWAVAFHQEIERIAELYNLNYDQLMQTFYIDSTDFKSPYFPGIIGGHCVMPNIAILQQCHPSEFWDIIEKSNNIKQIR
jgi:UDP-N-acetyl-D-mannosaminuronate dehydrogenase